LLDSSDPARACARRSHVRHPSPEQRALRAALLPLQGGPPRRVRSIETQCLAYELNQIPDIQGSALVLDAGCGTGRYSAAWRNLFPSATLVGVDINAAILKTDQVSPGALRAVNGNLEALPFKSGSFDIVMSRGALPAIADPARAVKELLRVCKPGGLLYFYTYRHGWYDVVLNAVRKVAMRLGAPFCSPPIYAVCKLARLDPRVATMILDELFVPIRNASSEETVLDWLHMAGVRLASIQPIVHAQFGEIELPVDRRTAWLHRVLPRTA
jgi:SAM-dependent methyltransferase